MRSWLKLALQPSVVRRAVGYAVVIGSILVAINHGDALLHGDLTHGDLWQILLTVLVPYLVSTSSSVGALRRLGMSGCGRETGSKDRDAGTGPPDGTAR